MSIASRFIGLPDNSNRRFSQAIASGVDTQLGAAFASVLAANPGRLGVYELPHGLDAFAARVVLARHAERSIDSQYYMWHQDTVGRSLVYELIDAADRGVRVRLLIDDMYGSDGQDTWLAMDVHPNIEVRLFAPYSRRQPKYLQFLTRFHNVNARMHTKTFTVDNQATIVGGRNIGDEYFDADPKLAFADNDVLAIGSAVSTVSRSFDDYWNGAYSYPVSTLRPAAAESDLQQLRDGAPALREQSGARAYFEAVRNGRLAKALQDHSLEFRWGNGEVVHDAWWKRDRKRAGWHDALLVTGLKPHLLGVAEELLIISPYFVPGEESAKALCELAAKGVAVRVLTNSLASNDVAAVHAGYTKYRELLLQGGVELYELDEHLRTDQRRSFAWLPNLDKSSLHAKSMIFDRKKMFVGSFNYDQRSLYLNTEIGLVFDVPAIAERAAQAFDANIGKVAFKVDLVSCDGGKSSLRWRSVEDGKLVTYDSEPYVGRGTKLASRMMRRLPVEWLL